MKKFFICALMVACLCAGSASAEFGSTDSSNLSSIKNVLTSSSSLNGGNLLYHLISISGDISDLLDAITPSSLVSNPDLYSLVRYLREDSDSILTALVGANGSISSPNSNSIVGLLQYLPNLVYLQTIDQDTGFIRTDIGSMVPILNNILTQSTTTATYQKYMANTVTAGLWYYDENGNRVKAQDLSNTITNYIAQIYSVLMWDGINPYTNDRTLYSRIKQLQEVLASDDDLALAESQTSNREQIESDFLNGDSGLTSLGSGDFADIAQIGGIVSSSISDAGSGIDSFVVNLNQTNLEAEGWFSAACRDSLDTVSSTVTYSLRDPDPYNMAGFTDRYESVKGGYEFDY